MRLLGIVLRVALVFLLAGVAVVAGTLIRNAPPLMDPPGPVMRLGTYLTTNSVTVHEHAMQPELRPRLYDAPPEATWEAARAAAERLQWEITEADRDERTLAAVAESPFLRFRDEIRIEVQPAEPELSTLRFRAHSRVGRGDLAMNTRHLLDFRQALRGELNALLAENAAGE